MSEVYRLRPPGAEVSTGAQKRPAAIAAGPLHLFLITS